MDRWVLLLGMICLALAALGCGGETDSSPADLSTPQATLAEYQRTLNSGAWSEHFDLFSEDSRDNLMIGLFITPQGDPGLQKMHREILEKYTLPATGDAPRRDPFSGIADRVSDPKAFYVEMTEFIVGAGDMTLEMLGFEDLEVDGDRATAKKVMHYVTPTMNFKDREPIRLLRVDGRWLVTMKL